MRLPGWPRLAPEFLMAVGRDGQRQTYRIKNRWDGRQVLLRAPIPAGRPCYLVLDHELPYRRKLQRLPEGEKGRLALLRAAPDEFPLPPDQLEFGLGLCDGEAYLYGFPREKCQELSGDGTRPGMVLVANGDISEGSCLAAIEQQERFGPSFAIGNARARYVSRRLLLKVALVSGLSLSTLCAAVVIAFPGIFGELIAWRTEQVRREAGDLPYVLRSSEAMAATQVEAVRLARSPEARLPQLLSQLFASVPPQHGIRRIEFDGKDLVVAGTGTDVQQWLGQAGFDPAQITVESTANFKRFRATRNLAEP